jgi:hypothetical protein
VVVLRVHAADPVEHGAAEEFPGRRSGHPVPVADVPRPEVPRLHARTGRQALKDRVETSSVLPARPGPALLERLRARQRPRGRLLVLGGGRVLPSHST